MTAEEEQYIDLLVEFQIFMNENDYITDYDWDFERMAIKFLNSKKQDL